MLLSLDRYLASEPQWLLTRAEMKIYHSDSMHQKPEKQVVKSLVKAVNCSLAKRVFDSGEVLITNKNVITFTRASSSSETLRNRFWYAVIATRGRSMAGTLY